MLSRNLAVVALLLAMLLWSSAYIAMKFAFQHYDPMVVMLGRMLISSFCFLWVFKRFCDFDYRSGDWKYLLIMVLSEPCLYFMFEAYALENTSAQQAGIVLALLPLLVSVGAWLWLGERLSRQALAGFMIAIAGAVWLSLASETTESAPDPLFGNFLELCAVLCAAGYILALKHLTQRYSPWFLTALQSFAGALFFAPMLALPHVTLPQALEIEGGVAIVYLGLFVNIGAYGLYNLSVSKVSASQSSAFINLIPVMTLVLAWLLLGERLNSEQLLASVLVMGGLLFSQWQPAGSVSDQQASPA